MIEYNFTFDDVRRVREERQCGMMTAKDILVKRQLTSLLEQAKENKDVELLADILLLMLKEDYIRKIA